MFQPKVVEAAGAFINAAGFHATRGTMEKYWDELRSQEARQLLAHQLTRHAPDSPTHQVIATRLHALKRSVYEGPDPVFAGYDEAAEAILAMLNAATWDDVRKAVDTNRHYLLPKVADLAFADLLMQPSTDDEQSHVLGGWNLIQQCRELGIEAAFERQLRPRRGIVLGPDVVAGLASAGSPEELAELPEVAPILARRREGQAQLQRWTGHDDYLAAMRAHTTPADLPKRVAACRRALASIDRDAMPLIWATVALDLADGLRKQLDRRTSADMTQVISLYREALTILTPQGEPEQFGHAQHYLGDAYVLDASGDAAKNVEAAIACYETALAMRRRAAEPLAWAVTTSHLGEALRRSLRGDRAVNIDRAVALLGQAIEVLQGSEETALLAGTRVSLAAALIDRVTGSREENLHAASAHIQTAMADVDPGVDPDVWAMATCTLGWLCRMQANADLASYEALMRKAETCFRAALDRAGAGARVQAPSHVGLAQVLDDRIGAGAEAKDEAIAHYEAALAMYKRMGPAFAADRGRVRLGLAVLYRDRRSGERAANVEAAERNFQGALREFSRGGDPLGRRDTLRSLGRMYFDEGRWSAAHRCFDEAIEISDSVLAGSYTEPGKQAEAAENRTLHGQAAYCLLRLARHGEALQKVERGKARMLNEALGWKDLDAAALPTEEQQALRWSRAEILRLEAESRRPDAWPDPHRQARLGRQLRDAYRHLAALRPATANASAQELDLEDMLAQIPRDGALVVPLVTPKGSAAFVVPGGSGSVSEQHVVELGSLTISTLIELLAGRAGSGGWLNAYLHWLNDSASFHDLLEALDLLASRLWEALIGPVHGRLKEFGVAEHAPVLVMPSGWLGLLPFHAASRVVDGQRRAFGQDFIVSYVPSARVLRTCRQRLGQRQRLGRRLLALANPTEDLPFAEAEASAIADLFVQRSESADVARVLSRRAGARSRVVGEMAGMNYLHFACHAEFHWTNLDETGLELAGGDWLRLPDILSPAVDLRSSRLVTLSACETGLSEFRTMPDEFLSLPGAFLEAGAPAVLSSLWPVNDISTGFLMAEFYRLHLEGEGVGAALQRAQTWLRESTASRLGLAEALRRIYEKSQHTDSRALKGWHYYKEHPDDVPFAHPFYWAAFTATGAC